MSALAKLSTGLLVTKPAQNLPQNATATLFTVTGGLVLVTGMLGLVTTAIQNVGVDLAISTPAGGNMGLSMPIGNRPVGTFFVPTGPSTNPIVSLAPFVSATAERLMPFLIVQGPITWITDANATGQMRWLLWYLPVDASATVS